MALFSKKKKASPDTGSAMTASHRAVSRYLSKVSFSYRFNGVDEADVWRKIEKLCELYEDALADEREKRQRLEALLEKQSREAGMKNAVPSAQEAAHD